MENLKNENIEIGNGVILTPKAVEQLASLQENENEHLKQVMGYLAEAICFIAVQMDNCKGEELEQGNRIMSDLSYSRGYLSDLKKPDELTNKNN
jgi:hypothetical protein